MIIFAKKKREGMKRFSLVILLMVAAVMTSCVKDDMVLSRSKATLYIVESKAGKTQLKPKTAKLSFKKVSALRYNISLDYTFKTMSEGDKRFTLNLKNVPFNIEGEMYTIDADWLQGIEGSGKINSEGFDFTGVNISGQIGTAADTWISLDGVTHGERFAIDITSVSESAKDIPTYKDEGVIVEYHSYYYATFRNDSDMKCSVILTFSGENPEVNFNLSPGGSCVLKEWRYDTFLNVCSDIEVDFANGNHIAGKPLDVIATSPEKDAPIKMDSMEDDWMLFVFEGGYIDRMPFTKYVFSIPQLLPPES